MPQKLPNSPKWGSQWLSEIGAKFRRLYMKCPGIRQQEYDDRFCTESSPKFRALKKYASLDCLALLSDAACYDLFHVNWTKVTTSLKSNCNLLCKSANNLMFLMRILYPIGLHTADATQLSSCVASASAVWTQFATSLRRMPTDSVDNLETSGLTVREFWSILITFSTTTSLCRHLSPTSIVQQHRKL